MELKHYVWIFTQSSEYYAKEIERMELDIVRHEHFIKDLIAVPHVARNRDRLAEIQRLTEQLKVYRGILAFCVKMREDLSDASAEEFAKQMVHNFKK